MAGFQSSKWLETDSRHSLSFISYCQRGVSGLKWLIVFRVSLAWECWKDHWLGWERTDRDEKISPSAALVNAVTPGATHARHLYDGADVTVNLVVPTMQARISPYKEDVDVCEQNAI